MTHAPTLIDLFWKAQDRHGEDFSKTDPSLSFSEARIKTRPPSTITSQPSWISDRRPWGKRGLSPFSDSGAGKHTHTHKQQEQEQQQQQQHHHPPSCAFCNKSQSQRVEKVPWPCWRANPGRASRWSFSPSALAWPGWLDPNQTLLRGRKSQDPNTTPAKHSAQGTPAGYEPHRLPLPPGCQPSTGSLLSPVRPGAALLSAVPPPHPYLAP